MDIIKQRQPKRAHGFMGVQHFAHKPKVRRTAREIETDQMLRLSPWHHMSTVATKVDVARVNWPGLLWVQMSTGMYDPKPRLVKR